MMRVVLRLWVLGLSVWLASSAWADSPLTTPDFALAYHDEPLVQAAAEEEVSSRVMEALSDPEVSHAVRAAMINAMGWSVVGAGRGAEYLAYIQQTREVALEALTLEALTAEEAFSLGYLLAMDSVHVRGPAGSRGEVGEAPAEVLLGAAREKAPESFAVALVASLVEAQALQGERWCSVYEAIAETVKGASAEARAQMREEAVAIVMEYAALYEPDCRNPKNVEGP